MFQPKYTISPQLLDTIKRVTLLVYRLNQKKPSAIVLMALEREARAISAYASTSIEGNPLPLTEVRRLLKNQPAQVRTSEREVLNYNHVLARLEQKPEQPFTRKLLLEIHRGVTKGLLPDHQSGRFRREPVVVHDPRSSKIVYLPPDHGQVEQLVDDLLEFVQTNRPSLDPLILAGLFHKQFMVIHPFIDGNGRTGRLATKRLLAGLGLNTFRLFSFENYYNQDVTRYFQTVGVVGNYYELAEAMDFTPWLEYFAEGILVELLRLEKQVEQQVTTDTMLEPYHRLILEYIDQHGLIRDKDYAQLTERAKATRSLDFKKLIALGLIERLGSGRTTYYRRARER